MDGGRAVAVYRTRGLQGALRTCQPVVFDILDFPFRGCGALESVGCRDLRASAASIVACLHPKDAYNILSWASAIILLSVFLSILYQRDRQCDRPITSIRSCE